MERIIFQKDIAAVLGINKSGVSALFRGKRRFSSKRAANLERITGIGIRTWLYGTPEEIKRELEKVYGTINFKRGRPLGKTETSK